jgi:hypothetical protein
VCNSEENKLSVHGVILKFLDVFQKPGDEKFLPKRPLTRVHVYNIEVVDQMPNYLMLQHEIITDVS